MESDVGIGIYPMSAGGVTAIDHRDRRVGMREQRVGKRHRGGAAANHKIVRFELFVHHLDDNTRRKAPVTNSMAAPCPETASTTRIEFRVGELPSNRKQRTE